MADILTSPQTGFVQPPSPQRGGQEQPFSQPTAPAPSQEQQDLDRLRRELAEARRAEEQETRSEVRIKRQQRVRDLNEAVARAELRAGGKFEEAEELRMRQAAEERERPRLGAGVETAAEFERRASIKIAAEPKVVTEMLEQEVISVPRQKMTAPSEDVTVSPSVALKAGLIDYGEFRFAEKDSYYVTTRQDLEQSVKSILKPGQIKVSPGVARKAGMISDEEYEKAPRNSYYVTTPEELKTFALEKQADEDLVKRMSGSSGLTEQRVRELRAAKDALRSENDILKYQDKVDAGFQKRYGAVAPSDWIKATEKVGVEFFKGAVDVPLVIAGTAGVQASFLSKFGDEGLRYSKAEDDERRAVEKEIKEGLDRELREGKSPEKFAADLQKVPAEDWIRAGVLIGSAALPFAAGKAAGVAAKVRALNKPARFESAGAAKLLVREDSGVQKAIGEAKIFAAIKGKPKVTAEIEVESMVKSSPRPAAEEFSNVLGAHGIKVTTKSGTRTGTALTKGVVKDFEKPSQLETGGVEKTLMVEKREGGLGDFGRRILKSQEARQSPTRNLQQKVGEMLAFRKSYSGAMFKTREAFPLQEREVRGMIAGRPFEADAFRGVKVVAKSRSRKYRTRSGTATVIYRAKSRGFGFDETGGMFQEQKMKIDAGFEDEVARQQAGAMEAAKGMATRAMRAEWGRQAAAESAPKIRRSAYASYYPDSMRAAANEDVALFASRSKRRREPLQQPPVRRASPINLSGAFADAQQGGQEGMAIYDQLEDTLVRQAPRTRTVQRFEQSSEPAFRQDFAQMQVPEFMQGAGQFEITEPARAQRQRLVQRQSVRQRNPVPPQPQFTRMGGGGFELPPGFEPPSAPRRAGGGRRGRKYREYVYPLAGPKDIVKSMIGGGF